MDSLQLPPATSKDNQAYRIASTLMDLLNDNSVPQALWWLDDQTFAADPKYFQTQVLDPYFRGTKYASFLRTMHKMGFARLSRRFDLPKGVVAYACELFCKEKPDLMHKIRMCNSGKQAQALKEAINKAKAAQQKKQQTEDTPKSPEAKPVVKEATPPASPAGSTSSSKRQGKELKASPLSTPKDVLSKKLTSVGGSPSRAAIVAGLSPQSLAATTSRGGSPRAGAGALVEPADMTVVRDYLDAKAANSAQLQLLRGQTALELSAQRMFLERQQQMQRLHLMQGPTPSMLHHHPALVGAPTAHPMMASMGMPPSAAMMMNHQAAGMGAPAPSSALEMALLEDMAFSNRFAAGGGLR